MKKGITAKTVEEYIAKFPKIIQAKLNEIRAIILENAPDAEEHISYKMPAYKYLGVLVYFGANKNHLGFYPLPSAVKAFAKELAPYPTSRGAIQLPYDQPLPSDLIAAIVSFRVVENERKAIQKKKPPKKEGKS